jgi:hypothetical protein
MGIFTSVTRSVYMCKDEPKYSSVATNNTTIQSEPFIRSKQDGCSDKTETYRYRRIFSSLYNSPISAPNRLADLLTFYYGDYTIKTTTNLYKMPVSAAAYKKRTQTMGSIQLPVGSINLTNMKKGLQEGFKLSRQLTSVNMALDCKKRDRVPNDIRRKNLKTKTKGNLNLV